MKTEIDHIDGNPRNNDPANLRIVTVESAGPYDPTNPFQVRGELQRELSKDTLSPINRALINRISPENRGVMYSLAGDLDRLLDAARRESAAEILSSIRPHKEAVLAEAHRLRDLPQHRDGKTSYGSIVYDLAVGVIKL